MEIMEYDNHITDPVLLNNTIVQKEIKDEKIQSILDEIKDLVVRKEVNLLLGEDIVDITSRIDSLVEKYQDIKNKKSIPNK
jgi:hypothetical protein